MPPMQPEEYRSRHRLSEELGIDFLGPIESKQWPGSWPETRRRLFDDITQLGRSQIDSFNAGDSVQKPWRAQIKKRAARVVHLAKRCRKEGKNESSWRACLEHEVFYRLTVEVSCPTCRDRLWRSEIEAAVESRDAQALSLNERRKQRAPCRCPIESEENQDFHGINMIFSDRAGTSIHYDPPLPIRSSNKRHKKYEQPDRIYGLIETQNFKALLNSTDKRVPLDSEERLLRDTLEASPFKGDREPLLFPFLLIEAKSDAVGDSAGVEMQSAFAIRRLLTVQHELRAATGAESKWLTGPLVWFFGWHGQDWYVKGSFMDNGTDESSPKYCILDLWQGNVCWKSSALQLLLIVDYIFDWARDGYRPSIIHELTTLAASEMQSFDPDIFSTLTRRESQLGSDFHGFSQDSLGTRMVGLGATEDAKPDSLHSPYIDTRLSLGVVRDASVIDSQFLALYVTEANVENFWSSLTTLDAPNFIARTMTRYLDSSWRVTPNTLSYIQAAWTGSDHTTSNSGADETFYVIISILFHVADNWSLVRQLTYLAISEGALHLLLSRANLSSGNTGRLEARVRAVPDVEQSNIEPFITSITRQSTVSNLTAAVGMLCLASSYRRKPVRMPKEWLLKRSKSLSAGFVLDSSPLILELVHGVYDTHRTFGIGTIGSLVRYSRNRNSQLTQDTEPCLWPRLEPIRQDQNGCALVEGLNLSVDSARYCLYIISKYDFGGSDTADAVERLAECGLYYSTPQLDSSQRLRNCFRYLNRSTESAAFWRDAESRDSVKDWVKGLGSHPQRTGARGESPNSPIMISSDEESNEDPMEEDD